MADNLTWTNDLAIAKVQSNLWKKIALFSLVCIALMAISLSLLSYQYFSKVNSQRLLLVPPTLGVGPINVEADTVVTGQVIKAISKRIVELNEFWSYESIEENFSELFDYYYDNRLTELTKSNLLSTNRFQIAKKNKMISTFKIDWKKSKFSWCGKLKRACSLIVGKRKVFINNNDPHKEANVAYLIFIQPIWPDHKNPHAARVMRLKIDDRSTNPNQNLLKQYELAMRGVLPDED